MSRLNTKTVKRPESLESLLSEIRACRACEAHLPHGVRPIIRASRTAPLCIAAQAPGLRVHETGLSFNDPSGDRLRAWMGIERETFYDERRVAIVGQAFCFPGYTKEGADKPPRKECAELWYDRLQAALPRFRLTLVVGIYAMKQHLGERQKSSMTNTVRAWREYGSGIVPLPHPSWRNNAWLKKNSWFERELLPELRARVKQALEP